MCIYWVNLSIPQACETWNGWDICWDARASITISSLSWAGSMWKRTNGLDSCSPSLSFDGKLPRCSISSNFSSQISEQCHFVHASEQLQHTPPIAAKLQGFHNPVSSPGFLEFSVSNVDSWIFESDLRPVPFCPRLRATAAHSAHRCETSRFPQPSFFSRISWIVSVKCWFLDIWVRSPTSAILSTPPSNCSTLRASLRNFKVSTTQSLLQDFLNFQCQMLILGYLSQISEQCHFVHASEQLQHTPPIAAKLQGFHNPVSSPGFLEFSVSNVDSWIFESDLRPVPFCPRLRATAAHSAHRKCRPQLGNFGWWLSIMEGRTHFCSVAFKYQQKMSIYPKFMTKWMSFECCKCMFRAYLKATIKNSVFKFSWLCRTGPRLFCYHSHSYWNCTPLRYHHPDLKIPGSPNHTMNIDQIWTSKNQILSQILKFWLYKNYTFWKLKCPVSQK